MFKEKSIYRHDTSKDLDIKIVKVTYLNENRVKLKINWINATTGRIIILPDGSLTDKIEVSTSDFQYWKQVKDKHANNGV